MKLNIEDLFEKFITIEQNEMFKIYLTFHLKIKSRFCKCSIHKCIFYNILVKLCKCRNLNLDKFGCIEFCTLLAGPKNPYNQ